VTYLCEKYLWLRGIGPTRIPTDGDEDNMEFLESLGLARVSARGGRRGKRDLSAFGSGRRLNPKEENPGDLSLPEIPISTGNRSGQNPSNRGATDLQTTGDFGFRHAGTV
jgi:hypothetical protein